MQCLKAIRFLIVLCFSLNEFTCIFSAQHLVVGNETIFSHSASSRPIVSINELNQAPVEGSGNKLKTKPTYSQISLPSRKTSFPPHPSRQTSHNIQKSTSAATQRWLTVGVSSNAPRTSTQTMRMDSVLPPLRTSSDASTTSSRSELLNTYRSFPSSLRPTTDAVVIGTSVHIQKQTAGSLQTQKSFGKFIGGERDAIAPTVRRRNMSTSAKPNWSDTQKRTTEQVMLTLLSTEAGTEAATSEASKKIKTTRTVQETLANYKEVESTQSGAVTVSTVVESSFTVSDSTSPTPKTSITTTPAIAVSTTTPATVVSTTTPTTVLSTTTPATVASTTTPTTVVSTTIPTTVVSTTTPTTILSTTTPTTVVNTTTPAIVVSTTTPTTVVSTTTPTTVLSTTTPTTVVNTTTPTTILSTTTPTTVVNTTTPATVLSSTSYVATATTSKLTHLPSTVLERGLELSFASVLYSSSTTDTILGTTKTAMPEPETTYRQTEDLKTTTSRMKIKEFTASAFDTSLLITKTISTEDISTGNEPCERSKTEEILLFSAKVNVRKHVK